jgi:uroporphyrinogen-III decarboxylase
MPEREERPRPIDTSVPKDGQQPYASFQEGAERMRLALAGEPGRVPVFAQMHEFVAAQRHIPWHEFFTNPEIMVPAMLEVQAEYDIDAASITYDVYNIEAEGLGQKLVRGDAAMPDIDRSEMLIRSRDDLSRIRTPDFASAGSFGRVIRMHALFRQLTGIEPTLSFCAPFSLAAGIRGIEALLLDLYDDPEFAGLLFDRLTEEVLAPWILYQRKQFPDATRISGADAIASPPIVNLPILRKWVVPYILRLRELCGPEVSVANWAGEHCLRNPEEMVDLKRTVGPGSLLGQDPDVDKLGPAFYKEYAVSHDLPLILGVGAGFLANSSPAAVVERVRRYVEAGRKGGRFALYLCNVGGSTPPENVRAAIEAAHE